MVGGDSDIPLVVAYDNCPNPIARVMTTTNKIPLNDLRNCLGYKKIA